MNLKKEDAMQESFFGSTTEFRDESWHQWHCNDCGHVWYQPAEKMSSDGCANCFKADCKELKWFPIYLAPQDGTELILLQRDPYNGFHQIEFGCWDIIETESWEEGGRSYYGWRTNDGRIEEPTHFAFPLSGL